MARRRTGSGTVSLVIVVLLALVGIGLIAYPSVSDLYYRHLAASQTGAAAKAASDADRDALAHELELCHEYNERLAESHVTITDPFDPKASKVTVDEYNERLDLAGNHVMATVYVPSIDMALPVYHGLDERDLERGAGHMEATSLPVGGSGTHSVIAGHTGLPNMRAFDRLVDVKEGDYVILEVCGETLAYRVYDIEVVLPDETQSLTLQPGRDLVTLVTCTPYGINDHRLLVHAERCDVPSWWDADAAAQTAQGGVDADVPTVAACSLVAIAVIVWAIVSAHRQHRRRAKALDAAGTGSGTVVSSDQEGTKGRTRHV